MFPNGLGIRFTTISGVTESMWLESMPIGSAVSFFAGTLFVDPLQQVIISNTDHGHSQ